MVFVRARWSASIGAALIAGRPMRVGALAARRPSSSASSRRWCCSRPACSPAPTTPPRSRVSTCLKDIILVGAALVIAAGTFRGKG